AVELAKTMQQFQLTIGVNTFLSISNDVLHPLVEAEVDNQVASQASFTAFDVTENLRSVWPVLNIVHGRVQRHVHDYMGDLIANGADYMSEYDNSLGTIGATVYKVKAIPMTPPAAPAPIQAVIQKLPQAVQNKIGL